MNNINKEKLYKALINGAKKVMENQFHLNTINVFPVADGDTGSNLYAMMNSIVRNAEIKSTIRETLESVADSAIVGARGNSGLIFAQYFYGISQVKEDKDEMALGDFVMATQRGFQNAYEAVEKPVEGTMLTTMRIFHESLDSNVDSESSIHDILETAYINVERAVAKTTEQLLSLKKASVVDSGAKGFAYFIRGFVDGIKGDIPQELAIEEQSFITIPVLNEEHHMTDENCYRYCTEALLEGDVIDLTGLKKEISRMGDSLVVAVTKNKVRLHVHTDRPDKVFDYLSSRFTILSQKVDDMRQQNQILHNRKHNRVIVTDSIADLPKNYIDNEQVVVIHLEVMLGTQSYIDKLTIKNRELFMRAEHGKVHPTSSQPSLKQVEVIYEHLLKYYEEVIVISVSSALSGTYNVLKSAAKNFGPRVNIIDSKQNSVAEGLLVSQAVEYVTEGRTTNEICDALLTDREKTKILVAIKTLDNMIASGRLSSRVGKIGNKIGLKPIITLDKDGMGTIERIAFSNKKAIDKIIEHLVKVNQRHGISRYAVTYVDDPALGNKFAKQIEDKLGLPCEYVVESSSVIAAGAGKGAVAVAYRVK